MYHSNFHFNYLSMYNSIVYSFFIKNCTFAYVSIDRSIDLSLYIYMCDFKRQRCTTATMPLAWFWFLPMVKSWSTLAIRDHVNVWLLRAVVATSWSTKQPLRTVCKRTLFKKITRRWGRPWTSDTGCRHEWSCWRTLVSDTRRCRRNHRRWHFLTSMLDLPLMVWSCL